MVIDPNTMCYLENLKLVKEDNDYLLDISIIIDTKFETKRCTTRAKLPIYPPRFSISVNSVGDRMIDLGFGELPCVGETTCEVIEEKEQIMTLDEIEKKLGYKIKLVSEK